MAERIIYEQIKHIERRKKNHRRTLTSAEEKKACPKRHQGFQKTRTHKRKRKKRQQQQQWENRSFICNRQTSKNPRDARKRNKRRKGEKKLTAQRIRSEPCRW